MNRADKNFWTVTTPRSFSRHNRGKGEVSASGGPAVGFFHL
jgi:hypothetical protein